MLCLQTLHAKPREENDPEKCRKGPQAIKSQAIKEMIVGPKLEYC